MNTILSTRAWLGLVAVLAVLPLAHVLAGKALPADAGAARVSQGLLVLYTFEHTQGAIIADRSGVGEPLDLKVERPRGVRRLPGRCVVTSSTSIVSTRPARKIIDAVVHSGELTVEAWVRPNDDRQAGPARIVSLSADPGRRNFTLGQDGTRFDVRLRARSTDANGLPSLATPDRALKPELTHVVYTRQRTGAATLYVNGSALASKLIGGDLSNWDASFHLSLANERTGDRPWLGELRLVAIYGRALSAAEVASNHAAGVSTQQTLAAHLPPSAARKVEFVADVQPILRQHCYACHAQKNERGGLNLGIRLRALEGGENGRVLEPGKSGASRLIQRVAAAGDGAMPPEGARLSAQEIGILRAWIDQGLAWPKGADVHDARTEQARDHWAFQPLVPMAPPDVRDRAWTRTPIDRFILAALEARQLRPSPSVSARRLIRRASFDLVGLPPDPTDVEAFVAGHARSPSIAWAKLVDRLLESPHYGERWGRHWLDVARYADSDGQESDRDRLDAYPYRDFVVRALNDDLPFDTFLQWQIAGDEIEPGNPAAVAATGFLTAGPNTVLEATFLEEERLRNHYNELDDMVSTLGTGMLGLTLGCARCHDHKYDPISSREYYRILSAFESGDRAQATLGPRGEKALVFRDQGPTPRPAWLFARGDFYDRDHPVRLGFPAILSRDRTVDDYWAAARAKGSRSDTTYQRRALAMWLTDVNSGAGALVARVIVNRVWQHHFGEGLVRTVSDFGTRGDAPTHPALLEWLANDFVRHGWRLKRLHRLILLSAVYGQDTAFDGARARSDPDNRLLWRRRPRRLEAEILRDELLAVSGTLNLQRYGPAFKPPIAAEAKVARNLKTAYPDNVKDSPGVRRRSIYMFHKRVIPYPLLQAFDRPDSLQGCGRREQTTVAPQALALLNDAFVRDRAADFSDRLLRECGGAPARMVDRAFALALGRPPATEERQASRQFLEAQTERRLAHAPKPSKDQAAREALADYCQSIFSLNEFLYVD